VLILHGCVCASSPRMSSTAERKGPSTRRRPRWGHFLGADSKKSLHERGVVFPMERSLGGIKRAQSSDVAGGLSVQKQLS
jgi:hypothetical protein